MKIVKWNHDVLPNGKPITGGGEVTISKRIVESQLFGGCSNPNCDCSPGHWICFNNGYNSETRQVSGKTAYFDNREELNEYKEKNNITVDAN